LYFLFLSHIVAKCTVQEAKPPVKYLIMQRWAEGFTSGVKGLTYIFYPEDGGNISSER
jgi:hypothetical protein